MNHEHGTAIHGRNRIATRLALVATLITATLIMSPAVATPGSGFVGTQVAKGLYGDIEVKAKTDSFDLKLKSTGASDIHVVRNAIAVGGHSGWHTHPGPSLITVTVGVITAYDGADPLCSAKVYHAGQGFLDPGSGDVHLLRNESGAPAETVAVQFLPAGAQRRIDAPEPTNCKF